MKYNPKVKTRISALAVMTALVTACGGGGSGDGGSGGDGSTNSKIEIGDRTDSTTTLSSQSVAEGQSTTVDLNTLQSASSDQDSGGPDLAEEAAIARANGDTLSASLSGTTVTIEANETDRPVSGLVLIGSDSGERLAEINVAVENTSAVDVVSEAEAYRDNEARLKALSEAKAFYRFEVLKAYMQKTITASQYQSLLDNWDVANEPSADALADKIGAIDTALNDYSNGQISDSDLESAVTDARLSLRSHNALAQSLMTNATATIGLSDYESVGEVRFHRPSESFSRFVGRDSLGVQTDSGWAFDAGAEKFALLTDVGDLASCYQTGGF